MSLQPIDRQRIKHNKTVANRSVPALVNRSNKTVLVELSPLHMQLQNRFSSYLYRREFRGFEDKCWY